MNNKSNDNPREKLMRETARVILQTIYDCSESERNEKWTIVKEIDSKKRKARTILIEMFFLGGVLF